MKSLITELSSIYENLEVKKDIVNIAFLKTKGLFEFDDATDHKGYEQMYNEYQGDFHAQAMVVDNALINVCKDYFGSELRSEIIMLKTADFLSGMFKGMLEEV
jgi:hypothetical protein